MSARQTDAETNGAETNGAATSGADAVAIRRLRRQVPDGEPTTEAIEDLPEVLTKGQAAWLLQLSVGQLQAAAQRGEIPHSAFGRTPRFSKTVLLRHVRGEAPG